MSYKSENWKEKLQQVRAYGTFTEHKEGSIESDADDLLNKQIEEEFLYRKHLSIYTLIYFLSYPLCTQEKRFFYHGGHNWKKPSFYLLNRKL